MRYLRSLATGGGSQKRTTPALDDGGHQQRPDGWRPSGHGVLGKRCILAAPGFGDVQERP